MAFMKLASDRLSMLKNGSRTGYRSEPQSTVCSRMCDTPLESLGAVRKATLNTLFVSSAAR